MTKTLYRVNEAGQCDLLFHPGQWDTWEDKRRFILMVAGKQSGKTSFGPWWLYREIQKCGAGDYLAVTSSFDLYKLKMLPEMIQVFENLTGIGRYWAGDRIMELRDPESGEFWATKSTSPMWGRIILRSAQSRVGLVATTAKAAWLDELGQDEFPLEAWDEVQARLSLWQGRVLGTTTLYNLGWLKREWYDRWLAGDKDYSVHTFPSYYNPTFPMAEYNRMEKTMPTWKFKMSYKGEYARPAGQIFHDLKDWMIVDPIPIGDDWETVLGIDFGGANTAIVYISKDPETDIWYVHRVYMGGGMSTRDHAERELEILERFTDWTATGGSKSEEQSRTDWNDAGLWVEEPTVSDVESGISKVIELIKTNKFRVFKTLVGMRDEFATYSRKLDENNEPTEEIRYKARYHRIDGTRYAAIYIVPGVKVEDGVVAHADRETGKRRSSWQ